MFWIRENKVLGSFHTDRFWYETLGPDSFRARQVNEFYFVEGWFRIRASKGGTIGEFVRTWLDWLDVGRVDVATLLRAVKFQRKSYKNF